MNYITLNSFSFLQGLTRPQFGAVTDVYRVLKDFLIYIPKLLESQ